MAAARGAEVKVGNVHSADSFYNPNPDVFDVMVSMGVLAVEMEAAGLTGEGEHSLDECWLL